VKLSLKQIWLMVLALAALLPGAGCGGINATKSVSPLDFLIPGGLLFQPDLRETPTNGVAAPKQSNQQLAFAQ
jgi:hypothetical protein